MKIKILLVFLGILLVPFVAGAAYNDVTLTTDTVISVGGISLNVSGSSAVVQSITVNADNFSFVLLSGSSIAVTSAGGRKFSTDANRKYVIKDGCSDTDSVYTLEHYSSDATVTVTATLGPSSCPSITTSSTTSSPGGGHRSSGGATTVTPATVAVSPPVAVATAPGQALFTRLLSKGSTGDDVRNLQTRLLTEGFFSGEVTGYFGPITQKAVKAYQAKYGIDQLGIVSPVTRAQLNKVFMANENSNAATTSQLTPAQVSAITAQISALLQQVQILQAKLKALGN